GRLLSRTSQDSSALEWWKKLEQASLLTLTDRRDYARSAIAAGELSTAAKQVDLLLAQKGGSTPIDALLAAHLAVRRGDTARAADYAERVLTDKRTRPQDVLYAAILILGITKPDSPPHINAWKRIEEIARDPNNAESLDALVFLAQNQKPLAATTSAGTSQPVTTMSASLQALGFLAQNPDSRNSGSIRETPEGSSFSPTPGIKSPRQRGSMARGGSVESGDGAVPRERRSDSHGAEYLALRRETLSNHSGYNASGTRAPAAGTFPAIPRRAWRAGPP
ncbi:MAG: hypothetical protein DME91_09035, partial [Verrucomicrobia bacterium]